jgi:hypothetical protein
MKNEEFSNLKEILDTSKSFEALAFKKSVAGLYHRIAISISIGMGFLLIFEALKDIIDEPFYSKTIFNITLVEFTLPQVGQVIFFLALTGDFCFRVVQLLTDQQFTKYLSLEERKKVIKKFLALSLILGALLASSTILMVLLELLPEIFGWYIMVVFIGGMLILLGNSTLHKSTLFIGVVILIIGTFMMMLPPPYWINIVMLFMMSSYIGAILSYFEATK